MIIKAFKYVRYSDSPREWKIVGKDSGNNDDYVYFNNLNLLVSRNGGGKSRTLNVIRELADLLASKKTVNDIIFSTQYFDFLFEHEGKVYNYVLDIKNRVVEKEILCIDTVEILNKEKQQLNHNGNNVIDKIDNKEADLLVTATINSKPLFRELTLWGMVLRNLFVLDLTDKNNYVDDLTKFVDDHNHIENPRFLIPVFYHAREKLGRAYVQEVIDCMKELDYDITDIDIRKTKRGYGIHVEEEGRYYVEQSHMSLKMLRALSLFIILVLARRENASMCVLIDDIGEGVDYDTAQKFINIIIHKSHNTSIQYFMTSNNRYIMNNIHLKYWSVIEREGDKSIFYNIYNSRDNFEDFKYTSLNNFDFFCTDFYKNGFGEDMDDHDAELSDSDNNLE